RAHARDERPGDPLQHWPLRLRDRRRVAREEPGDQGRERQASGRSVHLPGRQAHHAARARPPREPRLRQRAPVVRHVDELLESGHRADRALAKRGEVRAQGLHAPEASRREGRRPAPAQARGEAHEAHQGAERIPWHTRRGAVQARALPLLTTHAAKAAAEAPGYRTFRRISAPWRTCRLGDYAVLAPISEGGMASVWLGRAVQEPKRFAALKVIRPEHGRNKEFVAMFLDEAKIASRLSHPNIIAIHGSGHDGRRHFLAMEVLLGHTLLEVWERAHARKRKLPYELLAWIGARIADALHHAHELRDEEGRPLQVIHRDVSPSNIFLTDEGLPKLIDFGLAKARDRIASTAIGVIKGKLAYLAPEQVLGKPADRRADIFALGVTLWEISLDRRL